MPPPGLCTRRHRSDSTSRRVRIPKQPSQISPCLDRSAPTPPTLQDYLSQARLPGRRYSEPPSQTSDPSSPGTFSSSPHPAQRAPEQSPDRVASPPSAARSPNPHCSPAGNPAGIPALASNSRKPSDPSGGTSADLQDSRARRRQTTSAAPLGTLGL